MRPGTDPGGGSARDPRYGRAMPADPRDVLSRPAPAPDVTVSYGDHPDQLADLRVPAGSGPARQLVVVVHGGFWRAGYDRRHTDPLAAALAELGHPVAQVEYRRTGQPGGGWPATLTDVLAGVTELPRLAAEALPGRVAAGPPLLVGHSAGDTWRCTWRRPPRTPSAACWRWPRCRTSRRRTGWIWTRGRWPRCWAAARRTTPSGTPQRIHVHWCPSRHGQ